LPGGPLRAIFLKLKNESGFADSGLEGECAMRGLLVIALLGCIGAPNGYGQESSDRDARSRLIALERIAKLASGAKDMRTMEAILDEAFVGLDQDGRLLTKADALAYVQAAHSFQYLMERVDVRFHGDTAIATGLYQMKGIEGGKAYVRRGRFVDTWRHREGQWVIVASVSTPGE